MSLTHREVSEIRLRLNNGEKGCKLAKEFGVSNGYISQIKSKKKGTKQVWLTIEEAKEIIGTYIGTNCEIVKQHGIPELKIKNPSWLIHLLERIEQAEKGNETK